MSTLSEVANTATEDVDNTRLLVVIVNYKTGRLVVDCLASLESEMARFPNGRVAVVDNPSGDDSVAILRAAINERGWHSWVTLLRAPVNGGFSYGNNQAIRPALASTTPPDFIWILNPDTVVKPGAVRSLVDFMIDNPRVGIAGSSIEEANGEVWPYGFRFPNFFSEVAQGLRVAAVTRLLKKYAVLVTLSDVPERIDWLPGASMMVRRSVFEAVGLMDEEYFLYYEETDFCLKAARAGFECWYVPQSRVMHIAGQSTGVTSKKDIAVRLPDYWFESRTRYFLKNHGRLYGAVTDAVGAAAYALSRLRRRLGNQPDTDPPHYLRDFLRHSALLIAEPPRNTRTKGESRK